MMTHFLRAFGVGAAAGKAHNGKFPRAIPN